MSTKNENVKDVKKRPHQLVFTKPSLTKKSLKDEVNINSIMARYETCGIIEHLNEKTPHYGDYSEMPNYQNSLDKIIQANESFNSLPAQIRKQFDNDPAEFVEFCSNPENLPKLREMGLAEPLPQTPTEVSNTTENPSETPTAPENT